MGDGGWRMDCIAHWLRKDGNDGGEIFVKDVESKICVCGSLILGKCTCCFCFSRLYIENNRASLIFMPQTPDLPPSSFQYRKKSYGLQAIRETD